MDTVRRTYKYKLKVTPEQERRLEEVLYRCRVLYNAGLENRIKAYETTKLRRNPAKISRFDQALELKDIRAEMPEYETINSQVLQNVLDRLDKAYQAFYRRVKNGEKAGFPRYQGRNRYNSFTYPILGNGVKLDNGFLVLTKIGRIGVRWCRPIEGTIKTVTISREADGWYVCFSCAEVPIQPLPLTGRDAGVDVGLKVFLITSDGDVVENERHLRKAEKKIKKAQRRVSRRKKGSNRRRKAVKLLKRKHQKVQRQRRDFHFKTALLMVRQYDCIYIEDLQVANMVRNRHLAKSISDAGWAQFRSILECKAVYAGKRVVAVPPAYTSQDCSGCGERIKKTLSMRTHVCTSCGLVMDRDENAAINILLAGSKLRVA
ncbi:MAG: RNA-guided endonuclease InsQ/TnpB family protein [Ktedonobacterales bacterium]